jgi:hypothetical protein
LREVDIRYLKRIKNPYRISLILENCGGGGVIESAQPIFILQLPPNTTARPPMRIKFHKLEYCWISATAAAEELVIKASRSRKTANFAAKLLNL